MPGDVAKAFGAGADFVMLGGMLAGHEECGGEVTGASVTLKTITNLFKINTELEGGLYGCALNTDDGMAVGISGYDTPEVVKFLRDDAYAHKFSTVHPLVKRLPGLFNIDYTGATMSFYGMSSKTAMDKYNGGVAEYRASEGKTVQVPYRGPVEGTIKEILGGVRSACTYVGAKSLKEMSKRTTFVLCGRTHNSIFGQ